MHRGRRPQFQQWTRVRGPWAKQAVQGGHDTTVRWVAGGGGARSGVRGGGVRHHRARVPPILPPADPTANVVAPPALVSAEQADCQAVPIYDSAGCTQALLAEIDYGLATEGLAPYDAAQQLGLAQRARADLRGRRPRAGGAGPATVPGPQLRLGRRRPGGGVRQHRPARSHREPVDRHRMGREAPATSTAPSRRTSCGCTTTASAARTSTAGRWAPPVAGSTATTSCRRARARRASSGRGSAWSTACRRWRRSSWSRPTPVPCWPSRGRATWCPSSDGPNLR